MNLVSRQSGSHRMCGTERTICSWFAAAVIWSFGIQGAALGEQGLEGQPSEARVAAQSARPCEAHSSVRVQKPGFELWYTSPASNWNEALP